ncbi:YccF domain-containing protein [Tessaracoccus sp. HDW20]|uniref:YccF domain-containing protein n=1 Tax=Tessaracoccus coleopterorum TaxID=2714950 RepID=UPI0018D448E9|nr:YccF domain-containing protein [Tessaracoccus coleopterorum]NHB84056.1 YccF domain-containing protein [Tessaracoccus coleopterorum]
MRTVLNLIWVVLGGFWLALGYFVAGILACILVVTIPVGIASFRMARYVLWPFGKSVVKRPNAGAGSAIMNGIWFVIAGWWLALIHVLTALAQTLTIVGIANAWVSLKMIPVTCFPFGKQIVNSGGVL